MADGEHDDGVAIETVERDVAVTAERDQLLPELRLHSLDRPAGLRMPHEELHAGANGLRGVFRRLRILGGFGFLAERNR